MYCLSNLTFPDQIQFWLLVVGIVNIMVVAITAIILYRTLKEGQRQSDESRKQTSYSLAINQYNIVYQDLKGIHKKFEELNFKEILKKSNIAETNLPQSSRQGIEEANGLNIPMIYLFRPFLHPTNKSLKEEGIGFFRFNIIFPLLREYVSLFDFLKDVKNDKILSIEYKNRLYKIIERDILQSYFRICNYRRFTNMKYYLSSLQPEDLEDFYAINNFYIENNLFQYNPLDFYESHT